MIDLCPGDIVNVGGNRFYVSYGQSDPPKKPLPPPHPNDVATDYQESVQMRWIRLAQQRNKIVRGGV